MKNKWERPESGMYTSTKQKWRIERDYDRLTAHSYYRNWRLYDVSKGFDILIKPDFKSLKSAKEYADTH